MAKGAMTYRDAGVDIDANTVWVEKIRRAMTSTFDPRVWRNHGGFAGLFHLDYAERLFRREYRNPSLVGCADGVGTKVLLALEAGRLDTIGIDLVAMNVNDLITCGAEPLFFLDYLAVHKIEPVRLLEIIEGIAEGCRVARCALLGGETAEMPDLYRKGHIDLAGFAVGVVESKRAIPGRRASVGDVLVALPSSGVHSNGFTLVRRLLKRERVPLYRTMEGAGVPVIDALLTPTRIYVEAVLSMLKRYRLKRVVTGMAHITGGGLPENVGRILRPDCDAVIDRTSWTPPAVFTFLQRLGVDRREMYRVFNMGVGYVIAVRPGFVRGVVRALTQCREKPFVIGRIVPGKGKVELRQGGLPRVAETEQA
jgi:phosphoribosylformylglycinamidine cyclo-ligase